jgi:hypothetical protein
MTSSSVQLVIASKPKENFQDHILNGDVVVSTSVVCTIPMLVLILKSIKQEVAYCGMLPELIFLNI